MSAAPPRPAVGRSAPRVSPWALAGAAAIVAAAFLVGWPAIRGAWLWDDDTSITANAAVRGPYSLRSIWIAPEGPDYFPLTASAFWAEWHLFGDDVTGYHVVNIALHAISGLLVWALVRAMRLPGGWLAGMLFTVHPLCVESVAWISELKNTLSQPLFLLAAIHAVRADAADRPRVTRDDVATAGWFLAAMLAKTSVVMFPVVILLYVWWRRGHWRLADIAHSAPFFLVSLLLGLMTIYYQHGRAVGLEKMPIDGILPRFAIAGMAIPFYVWKTVFPYELVPIYPQWQVHPPRLWQLLPWPLLAGAVIWMWANRGTAERPGWGRHVLFAFGFFVLMLLPILGFITISYMRITWVCDHFLYLPMISLIVLGVAAAATWAARADVVEQRLLVVAAGLLLAVLAFLTFRYAHVWFNEDKQWTYTLAKNPDAWQAHNRLGAWKAARGDVAGAHEHFKNSSRLRPDLGETHNNLGTTHLQMGNVDEAIAAFERAIAATPHLPLFRVNLLSALLDSGRLEQFDAMFDELLAKEDPASLEFLLRTGQDGMAMENAANAAAAAGRTEEARQAAARALTRFEVAARKYKQVLDKHPRNGVGWNNYAVMLMKQGRKQEAVNAFEKALAITPSLVDARMGLEAARRELEAGAGQPTGDGAPRPNTPLEMQVPTSPTLGPAPLFGK